MTDDPDDLDPRRLLRHQRFLTRLAGALVRDEHTAEDLVQDTWVAALEHGPSGSAVAPRSWLGRTLRNRSINRWKLGRSRAERERTVAREERVEALDAAGELDVESRVLAAVRDLPEPQRSTIWMRYWRDLGPADIATELGVPLATVKSRLARGRTLLRERLARELGDGSGASDSAGGWRAILLATLPSTGTPAPTGPGSGPGWGAAQASASSFLGVAWMSTKLKLSIVGLAIAAGAFTLARSGDRELVLPGVRAEPRAGAGEPALPTDPARPDERVALEVVAPPADTADTGVPPETAASVAAGPAVHRGRVLDDEARPVVGVDVVLTRQGLAALARGVDGRSVQARTMSEADGTFVLEKSAGSGRLEVDDPDWVTIGPALLGRAGGAHEEVVLAAPRAALTGVVVDEQGLPVPDAEVSLELPPGFRSRFPVVLDHTTTHRPEDATDADGRFSLPDAVRVRGGQLLCAAEGFRTRRTPVDGLAAGEVTLHLARLGQPGEILEGQVVDPLGLPVADARVSFGGEIARTDATGRFALPRLAEERGYDQLREALGEESATVIALAAGFRPGRQRVELDGEGRPLWPDGMVLQLGDPPLSIEGVVLDGVGAALPDAMIWLDEVTVFSMVEGGRSEEALLAGAEERYITFRTGADGSFTIPGLLERDYVVVAMDPRTNVMVKSEPVAAGTLDLTLLVDSRATWDVVAGKVLDPDGGPVAGVMLLLMTDAGDMRFQDTFVRTSNLLVRRTTTDDEGRFRMDGVPRAHVYLEAVGDDIEMTIFDAGLLTEENHDRLELVARRRVHVQVTLDAEGLADAFSILDAYGEPLALRAYRGKPGPPMLRAPLHGLRSDPLSVSEAGSALVLYLDGEEVDRRGVALRADELNEL